MNAVLAHSLSNIERPTRDFIWWRVVEVLVLGEDFVALFVNENAKIHFCLVIYFIQFIYKQIILSQQN